MPDKLYVTINKLPSKKNKQTGTLNFMLRMGVGSGLWVSDQGSVLDLTIMKASKLPVENENNDIIGLWKADENERMEAQKL